MKEFKEDELVIYQNGDRFEIGKIKRVTENAAYVYYHSGDTAARTPLECIHKLQNSYCIPFTILGGESNWIPVKTRPMNEEEKEYYGEGFIYDCKLPDEGEEVLITSNLGNVVQTTFYTDMGSYFEGYEDEGEVIAWQPIPEPYKEV